MEKEISSGKSNLFSIKTIPMWALSFGCTVGWGAFVMPGTTFLPSAGPLGTALAITVGALLMLLVAGNFHVILSRSHDTGGIFSCTRNLFGYDHAFLCIWAIGLAYISILWANATAFVVIIRYLFGPVFQWGFHYTILGYDVYLGEILLTIVIIACFAGFSSLGQKTVSMMQTVFALILFFGVVICFLLAVLKTGKNIFSITPSFSTLSESSEHAKAPILQVINIAALAPWAFMGFEAISVVGENEGNWRKKTFVIMAFAIFCGTLVYVLLTFLSVLSLPENCSSWTDYIGNLSSYDGIDALPTFHAAKAILGKGGVILLGISVLSALSSSLLGLYCSSARILKTISRDEVIPKWFGKMNRFGSPSNAILCIMLVSLLIPFVGRTSIGWLCDIITVSACIAYVYICSGSVALAKIERKKGNLILGIGGIIVSVVMFFFPLIQVFWNVNALSTESYLILSVWSITGFAIFRVMFQRDKKNRFGKSVFMWLAMLFLIFFSATMWMRQITHEQTEDVIENISEFHLKEHKRDNIPISEEQNKKEKAYMEVQMNTIRNSQLVNSLIQLALTMSTLIIVINIFATQKKRENKLATEKQQAEESNRAKTVFLSNMSHDIRTPMNAIVGYTKLARKEGTTMQEMKDYLNKIDSSSKHLLALINDVLEMSRIESGKMEIEENPADLRHVMEEMRDMFATQMQTKNIDYSVECMNLKNPHVLCDTNRLNRVLLNLISNAYKFTPEKGFVKVILSQTDAKETIGTYELRVKDSGIGMSPEFAEKVFEAFEREETSTVSGIQGTGLGMAITKNILDLMGGTITVNTKKGEGTEFIISISFLLQEKDETFEDKADEEIVCEESSPEEKEIDFSTKRLLLVDDVDVNREIALMLLSEFGFKVETAVNGKEAVDKVEENEAGWYDAIIMDVQMPVMAGHEASRKIRELSDKKKASVPIVAMTANAFEEDVKQAKEAGMNAHVSKPIDMKKLILELKKLI